MSDIASTASAAGIPVPPMEPKRKRAVRDVSGKDHSSAASNKNQQTTGKFPSVDPRSAEDLLAAAHLGNRIKRLRLKRSMGLVELGKLTGLSASFLSQLETGRVVPTLRNLARIALVFSKDLSHFFEAEDQSVFRVQRKKDRVRLAMGTPQAAYIAESFGILVPEGGMRPCMAEFLPGHDHEPFRPERYAGVEMAYVLDGSIEFDRNGELHTLHQHDLMYVSGETQRSYRSAEKSSVRALIISFDDGGTKRPVR